MNERHPSLDDVLAFWFAHSDSWWKKSPEFDSLIRDRFLALHGAVMRGECDAWLATPRGGLAYVIVLDQFSRNMFRDTARMYEGDVLSVSFVRRALENEMDKALSKDERMFLFMPLMHSENISDQERCLELFASAFPNQLPFAKKHHDIVRRFGRFPHRNAILARPSTPEEIEFLKEPGSSF